MSLYTVIYTPRPFCTHSDKKEKFDVYPESLNYPEVNAKSGSGVLVI